MRFIYGPIPPSETFKPSDAGWVPLDRSESDRFVIVASAMAMVPLAAGLLVLFSDDASTIMRFKADPRAFTVFIVSLLLLVPVHEFIHALAYGVPLHSRQLITGIWLSRFAWYVLYDAPLRRRRVLLMSAAPFTVLTTVGVLAVWLVPREWQVAAGFVLLIHTSLCTGDALVLWRLLNQVPKDAFIHNDGWRTYWGRI